MSSASREFLEQAQEDYMRDREDQQHAASATPQVIEILPGSILTLSKTNAQEFHRQTKAMIMETGYGIFEYLEVINFFIKIKSYISGDKQAKIPEDKEFIELVREEIGKHPKGKFTSARGVTFETAETGTAYDFGKCDDPVLVQLEADGAAITERLKARKEFLKTLPLEGLDVLDKDSGEVTKIFPPSKSSNSSYKITLPK